MDRTEIVTDWDVYFRAVLNSEGVPFPSIFPRSSIHFGVMLYSWFAAYRGNRSKAGLPAYIPEPYIGDLLSNSIKMVFLETCPGKPLPFDQQMYCVTSPVGRVIATDGYYPWAQHNPYTDGNRSVQSKVWANRMDFAGKLLGEPVDHEAIVGMNLWPWHCLGWGGIDVAEAAQSINECVLEPLGDLSQARKGSDFLIIARGQELVSILLQLGFGIESIRSPILPSGNRQVYRMMGPYGLEIIALISRKVPALPVGSGRDIERDLVSLRDFIHRKPVLI